MGSKRGCMWRLGRELKGIEPVRRGRSGKDVRDSFLGPV